MKNPRILKNRKFYSKASSAETNLANQQASFYSTLSSNYATQFANQSNVLASLKQAWSPILAAGPGQFGFTPQETASLRTGASDQIAQGQVNAQKALNNTVAAEGGGNAVIPSGATQQLDASLLSSSAQQNAATQNQITQAGYQTGLQNFNNASNALSGVSAQYNPLGFAGQTTGAGNSAFSEADTVNTENNAWKSALAGAIGGIGGAVLGGPIGAEIGSGIGNAVGGGGGGSLFTSTTGAAADDAG